MLKDGLAVLRPVDSMAGEERLAATLVAAAAAEAAAGESETELLSGLSTGSSVKLRAMAAEARVTDRAPPGGDRRMNWSGPLRVREKARALGEGAGPAPVATVAADAGCCGR